MADSVLATIKIKNSLVDSSSIFTSIIKKTITCDSCLYNLNPLFVDTAKLDFHLLPCSPAINVGNNAYAAGLKTDFEGKSRVFYDKIDLGAYEYNGFDVPSFSANATICESKQGSFLPVLKENCSNTPTINWTNDKNESGTGGNNLGQGTYTFIVKDSNQCTDTIKNVKIQSKGSIGISFVKTDVSSATAKNGTITITDVPNGKAPIQYLWSTGDTTNQVKNLAVGIYGISIVDANGCKFSTTIQMSATTSVSELSGFFDVQLSPNPVSDYLILTVFGKMEEKVNVEVFTLEGRLIYAFESDKPTFGLDVQSYQQGLYLVKMKNNQGEFVKKFMKK